MCLERDKEDNNYQEEGGSKFAYKFGDASVWNAVKKELIILVSTLTAIRRGKCLANAESRHMCEGAERCVV